MRLKEIVETAVAAVGVVAILLIWFALQAIWLVIPIAMVL